MKDKDHLEKLQNILFTKRREKSHRENGGEEK